MSHSSRQLKTWPEGRGHGEGEGVNETEREGEAASAPWRATVVPSHLASGDQLRKKKTVFLPALVSGCATIKFDFKKMIKKKKGKKKLRPRY